MILWLKDIKFFNLGGCNYFEIIFIFFRWGVLLKIIENNLKYLG